MNVSQITSYRHSDHFTLTHLHITRCERYSDIAILKELYHYRLYNSLNINL